MDLIRIYSEIAFSRVADTFLSGHLMHTISSDGVILPEDFFIDQGRRFHPEMSDDNLKMIYRLGEDDWSRFGYDYTCSDSKNIFQVLAYFAHEMLEEIGNYPLVHFKDLFRWRDTTQVLGEDLLTCTFLAFRDRDISVNPERKFDWPSVVHNDNPHLAYLFKTKELCELHSHLQASANVFEISWVSLMNFVNNTESKFEELAKIHYPSKASEMGKNLFRCVTEAAYIRWSIFNSLKSDQDIISGNYAESETIFLKYKEYFECKSPHDCATVIDSYTETERMSFTGDNSVPDYIKVTNSPMGIYAGERWFLYSTIKRIFSTNSPVLTHAFYRYILCKSLLRSYFVQINNNIGFSNFQRFQNVKSKLLSSTFNYRNLLRSLPIWEAKEHNYIKLFETRITPLSNLTELRKFKRVILSMYKDNFSDMPLDAMDSHMDDWSLIFHFIKQKSKENSSSRDTNLRASIEASSKRLTKFRKDSNVSGVDAASSELAVRPELFSQAFRFLRYYGFKATFHAGEDFYDIADGLRAIDESIRFLKLKSSDRLGHALALGIDTEQYYSVRHNYIALPIQWMLDNVVWILIRSKEFDISIPSQIERFLIKTYKDLCTEIGYAYQIESDSFLIPEIEDYWDSMILRGDSPEAYQADGSFIYNRASHPGEWEFYSLLNSEDTDKVRKNNLEARKLYYLYHHQDVKTTNLRERGNKVKSYKLPNGYPQLMKELQDSMIEMISKRQLCIECCPSSNVKIGKLERFDSHPIFRFMPLDSTKTRYPLAVTVNTDDLGVFATSLPNEFSLLALALLKKKDQNGNHIYSSQEVYDWIGRVIDNGHKFTFQN